MGKPRALLLDSGFSARPILESLTRSGVDVTVVGKGGTGLVEPSADQYIDCDYSDIEAIRNLAIESKADFVIPGVTDVAYSTCAQLAGNVFCAGVDTAENTRRLADKRQFRLLCEELCLPAPRILDRRESGTVAACIVKPADSYSGRGITVVNGGNKPELTAAIASAESHSASGSCVIEEFVSGQLYSHSCLLKEKRVVHDFVVAEYCVVNPFAVDVSHIVEDFDQALQQQLRDCAEKIAGSLGLVDGLFHTQFIAGENGIVLIEVTRRCPGDLYSLLIQHATGFPYADFYVAGFTGDYPDVANDAGCGSSRHILRHTIKATANRYQRIEFFRSVNILEWVTVETPQSLQGKSSGDGRIAVMFTASENRQEQEQLLQAALARKLYRAV